MFLLALSRVKEALSDPVQQAAIDKATRRITPKGQLGKWTSHSLVQRGPLEGPGFFKFQKIRRRLGRLFELRRLVLKQIRCPDNARQGVISNLITKLNRGGTLGPLDDGDLTSLLRHVLHMISFLRDELKHQEMDHRKQVLKQWKHRILNDPKALGSWLRNRFNTGEAVELCYQEQVARTSPDIAARIFDFWNDFWEQSRLHGPTSPERDHVLQEHAVNAQVTWIPPTVGEVLLHSRDMHGSGGVDGWRGSEIRHLPSKALEMFHGLASNGALGIKSPFNFWNPVMFKFRNPIKFGMVRPAPKTCVPLRL